MVVVVVVVVVLSMACTIDNREMLYEEKLRIYTRMANGVNKELICSL